KVRGELGAGGGFDGNQGREWHHRTGIVAHEELANVLDMDPVSRVGLEVDLPLPAKAVEIVYIKAAHEGLQRRVHIADVNSELEHLITINPSKDLWHGGVEQRRHTHEFRPLACGVKKSVDLFRQEFD